MAQGDRRVPASGDEKGWRLGVGVTAIIAGRPYYDVASREAALPNAVIVGTGNQGSYPLQGASQMPDSTVSM